MHKVKYLLFFFVLFSGVTLAARCTLVGSNVPTTAVFALSGQLTIPKNIVPGEPISGVYGYSTITGGRLTSCDGNPKLYVAFNSTQVGSSLPNIMKTNIPGVGIKVWTNLQNGGVGYIRNNIVTVGTIPQSYGFFFFDTKFQFYAIDSNISEGRISLSQPLTKAMVGDTALVFARISINSSLTVNHERGCSVTNSNQTVTLQDASKAELRNHPGRYPKGKEFNIALSCDPQTKVSVKFEGTTMPGQDSVLANQTTGDGSAGASVGIQMLYDNNPVTLGQPLQVLSNAQSSEQLPFSAHYYYNGGADIQAGNVTATTTFNFTYQ